MKDFYKRLRIEDTASAEQIRAALDSPRGEAEVKSAADFVLNDPHRRAVYDTNRRLLLTIGTLRARLRLTAKPFWMRGDFRDFTPTPVPPVPSRWRDKLVRARTIRKKAPTDALIAAALITGRQRGNTLHGGMRRWGVLALVIAIAAALLLICLHSYQHGVVFHHR